MAWMYYLCSSCPNDLLCVRPRGYTKPVICLHRSISNFTQLLREGVQPTAPTTAATVPNVTAICPATSSSSTNCPILSTMVIASTVLISVLFLLQLFLFGLKVRHAIANRLLHRQLVRRQQKKQQTLRSLRRQGAQETPLVVLGRRPFVPQHTAGAPRVEANVPPDDGPVYDVPAG
ncbi:hypothetical protein niasHT_028509 [Heterodera trifolii]|uniref:Uncharacterized protein n=1 Tax=Heterodera trifolii TaxID=157864 RepID=A0ABD2IQD3_9BILA